MQLINNDSLRLDIINTYDFTFLAMVQLEEEEEAFEFFKNYAPALIDRLSQMNITYYQNNVIRTIDYPANYRKRKDHQFIFLTNNLITSRSIMINFYVREGKKVRELMGRINQELEKLGG